MKNLIQIIIVFLLSIFLALNIQAQTATNKIDSTGNVGIGTITPLSKLHIFSGGSRNQIRTYGHGNGSSRYINIWHGTEGGIIDAIGGGDLYLGYDTSTKIILNRNGGNVGVGNSNPSEKLSVTGNIYSNSRLLLGSFTNKGVGRIQIRHEGGNNGIVLWTETGNITKRIWIDDASNTLQITAGVGLNNGLSVNKDGKIGVGTSTPDQKLTVKGKIHSEEVIVDLNVPGPDYVFEEDYDLTTLKDLEAYIKVNKHLPEIPSAKEMEANGITLGKMNMLLLKKIEELTLHAIEQEKKLDERHKVLEEEKERNNIQQGTLNIQQQQLQSQQKLIERVLQKNKELITRIEQLEKKGEVR
ncbi:hypothetical protein A8B79_05855 [Balneola sp. EhC07]|uniref:tail fiber protein n=1 Tax=Balneola sp. EhC07 TaxID=1849360 RepID=UPI0007F4557D|nr:tail fiber protein [Balneola sp. EhC07]OAN60999.1 hypothetical protein A8B79_05855 [Balneola sp. EhC07]